MQSLMERNAVTSHGRLKVDGILVHLVNADNPLQLINSAAPGRYGSAEDNVVRDPASGDISSLKFPELRFCILRCFPWNGILVSPKGERE